MAAVERFYSKVVTDDVVGDFFAELDLDKQITKQISFLSRALGGPAEYHGRDLRIAHAPLVERGLSNVHFDRVLKLLEESLGELEVPRDLIDEVTESVEATRSEVLGG